MAQIQRDMDDCLAAIDSHNEAILQHSQAIAKLMSEVQRLRGIRDATVAEDESDSETSNETTSAVLKSSAAILGVSLWKPKEADSNMVMTAARQVPSCPSLPVEDSAVVDTLRPLNATTAKASSAVVIPPTAGAEASKPTPKEEPKSIQPTARESATAGELVPLQSRTQAAAPAFTFPPLPASALCPSFLLIKPFKQISLAKCAKVKPEKSDLVLRIPRQKTFRLLSLPRELRDQIYKYAVAPGVVLIKSRNARHESRSAQTDDQKVVAYILFQVSKQVNQEAMEVYFKQNLTTFHADKSNVLFIGLGNRSSFRCHLKEFLTSVSLVYDARDISVEDILAYAGSISHRFGSSSSAHVHDFQLRSDFIKAWSGILQSVLHVKTLRFLKLDVTNCYDMSGCCRFVDYLARTLKYGASVLPPLLKAIEIKGTKSIAERRMFLHALLEPHQSSAVGSYQRQRKNSEKSALRVESAVGMKLHFKKSEVQGGSLKLLHAHGLDTNLVDEVVEVCQDYCLARKRKSGDGGEYGGLSLRPRPPFVGQPSD